MNHLPKPSYRGKVRDIYYLEDTMIIVVSDRISAFDIVFEQNIPDKGRILTSISNHWFSLIHQVKNHLLETDISKFPPPFCYHEELAYRSVWVKRAKRIDFECVVRGYLLGSAFKEYQKTGKICGIELPPSLKEAQKLPEPIFTPAAKIDKGNDQNVTHSQMVNSIGKELTQRLEELSLQIYSWAASKLAEKGILLLDTKFEFGLLEDEIILIDEVLTPDSSRFSKKTEYQKYFDANVPPPYMDKQVVRDHLNEIKWNKKPPAPVLPQDVLDKTNEKYVEIEKTILQIK